MTRGLTHSNHSDAPPSGSLRQRHGLVDRLEPLIEALIRLCGWSSILFVFAIFIFVFREAFPVLHTLSLGEIFGGAVWNPAPDFEEYGILTLIVGSLAVTFLSMAMAVNRSRFIPPLPVKQTICPFMPAWEADFGLAKRICADRFDTSL